MREQALLTNQEDEIQENEIEKIAEGLFVRIGFEEKNSRFIDALRHIV